MTGRRACPDEALNERVESDSFPQDIVTGSDGNLWFTSAGNRSIGRMTPKGVVSMFADPGITAAPQAITTGRITPAGAVTIFPTPAATILDITRGPDGNVWFTAGSQSIGRITPSGVVTLFADAGIGNTRGIATGPDGALWFTSYEVGRLGRITTAGNVRLFDDLTEVAYAFRITAGPDGAMWFARSYPSSIGRIQA